MLIAPALAFLNLKLLGAQGLLFAVLFVLASMPVSVNSVILADKFDASKDNVSRCILWTTLASLIVLPVLITLVK
jgi:predicted permease